MNLPNKISLTRILMIPFFVTAFFLDGVLPYNYLISAVIFAVAACTDFVDGYIARSRNLITNIGKFLDSIADKVLVATAMIVVLATKDTLFTVFGDGANVAYIVTCVCICIILAREFIISAFRQIAAANGLVMAAEKLGKYKAACQDVALFMMLFAIDFTGTFGTVVAYIGFGLFAVATVLTIVSGVSYVAKNKNVLKED
ncbi:MAG: CDP-diacylglycerol--glycerol-3-phosphate 3-phosphatidyltransferase [Clostridia bacterium]|nr:CDP-diacylglycerol--glycerol-3-phosphate 3-phosphatidyltransferase [Clostridia bacterium]